MGRHLKLTLFAVGLMFGATGAHAFPVTWTLTGQIDTSNFVRIGIFAGLAVAGDTSVVTHTFDGALPPRSAFREWV